jgi:hypothetical protein
MADTHPIEQRRPAEAEGRLPLAQSVVVIVGLSALSWAVLILIIVAFRTLAAPT